MSAKEKRILGPSNDWVIYFAKRIPDEIKLKNTKKGQTSKEFIEHKGYKHNIFPEDIRLFSKGFVRPHGGKASAGFFQSKYIGLNDVQVKDQIAQLFESDNKGYDKIIILPDTEEGKEILGVLRKELKSDISKGYLLTQRYGDSDNNYILNPQTERILLPHGRIGDLAQLETTLSLVPSTPSSSSSPSTVIQSKGQKRPTDITDEAVDKFREEYKRLLLQQASTEIPHLSESTIRMLTDQLMERLEKEYDLHKRKKKPNEEVLAIEGNEVLAIEDRKREDIEQEVPDPNNENFNEEDRKTINAYKAFLKKHRFDPYIKPPFSYSKARAEMKITKEENEVINKILSQPPDEPPSSAVRDAILSLGQEKYYRDLAQHYMSRSIIPEPSSSSVDPEPTIPEPSSSGAIIESKNEISPQESEMPAKLQKDKHPEVNPPRGHIDYDKLSQEEKDRMHEEFIREQEDIDEDPFEIVVTRQRVIDRGESQSRHPPVYFRRGEEDLTVLDQHMPRSRINTMGRHRLTGSFLPAAQDPRFYKPDRFKQYEKMMNFHKIGYCHELQKRSLKMWENNAYLKPLYKTIGAIL